MKIAFCTDIHLDFESGNNKFFAEVLLAGVDAMFISGDIAQAGSVCDHLKYLSSEMNIPIYFVLGNHDYYYGSISKVRKKMVELTNSDYHLHWLPETGAQELTEDSCVVGVDGWYDGRYGDADPPKVIMNDWNTISDLSKYNTNHEKLLEKLRSIAKAEADLARIQLNVAAAAYKKVFFLTHVPPWQESAWHENNFSGSAWAPWFTSMAMGDVLEEVAEENPHVSFNVLCGHTHSGGELHVAHNLVCKTGSAVYGKPKISEVICIKSC